MPNQITGYYTQYKDKLLNDFDKTALLIKDRVIEQFGEKFAPYICMSDIVLSDAMGWGLIRTQSLADGCAYCDFRFKEGAPTQVSSKTPEAQSIIDEIGAKEAQHKSLNKLFA